MLLTEEGLVCDLAQLLKPRRKSQTNTTTKHERLIVSRVFDVLGVDVIRVDLLPFRRITLQLSPLGACVAPFLTSRFLQLDQEYTSTSVITDCKASREKRTCTTTTQLACI